ncbi:dehydrogenase [Streptomyces sp. NPDC056747]|uniref:dehydrogenase n=1 Tax=Streptomyces sp. NPDC056747 TaxID=3345935 RepID=UPI0036BA42CD
MADWPLHCPDCGRPMEWKGLVLSKREEDDQRVCRSLWRCQDRTLWWHWADREDDPLELCPFPNLVR